MQSRSALALVALLGLALCIVAEGQLDAGEEAAAFDASGRKLQTIVTFPITKNIGNVAAVQAAANLAGDTGLLVNTQQVTQQNAGNGNGNINGQLQNGRKLKTFTFPTIANIGNVAAVQEAANIAANTGLYVNTQQATQQNAGNGNGNSNTQIQNGRKLQTFPTFPTTLNLGNVAAVQGAANLAGNTGLLVNTQQATQQNAGNGNGNINGQLQNGR